MIDSFRVKRGEVPRLTESILHCDDELMLRCNDKRPRGAAPQDFRERPIQISDRACAHALTLCIRGRVLLTIAARLARNAHRTGNTREEAQMLDHHHAHSSRPRRPRHRGVVAVRDRPAGRGRRRNSAGGRRLHRLSARCSWIIGITLFLAGVAYLIYKWTRNSKSGPDAEPT